MQRSRHGKLQSVSTTCAHNQPYWLLQCGTGLILLQVIQPCNWSLHHVPVNSLATCMAVLLLNYPNCLYSSFATFWTVIFVSNVDNFSSMEENEKSKCRWEYSKKVWVNYVTIQYSDWKFWPLWVWTFLRLYVLFKINTVTAPKMIKMNRRQYAGVGNVCGRQQVLTAFYQFNMIEIDLSRAMLVLLKPRVLILSTLWKNANAICGYIVRITSV